MNALLEQQRAFCAQLLGEGLVPEQPRLRVYRHTCIATLTQAMRLTYPAVRRLVGEEFFDVAALGFIEQALPRQACLNSYGDGFDRFLRRYAPAASVPYLPDVARLELAVNRALYAPDCPGIGLRTLMRLSEDQQPSLRLIPHPSLTLLQLQSPADRIWRAVLDQDEATMATIDPGSGPVYLLIERDDEGIQVRRMVYAHWQFSSDLTAAYPLQRCLQHADEHTHAVLADHLARGRFIGFEIGALRGQSHSGEDA